MELQDRAQSCGPDILHNRPHSCGPDPQHCDRHSGTDGCGTGGMENGSGLAPSGNFPGQPPDRPL